MIEAAVRFCGRGREAPTIGELVSPGDRLDLDGVAEALGVAHASGRSIVDGIRRVSVVRGPSMAGRRSIEEVLGEALPVSGAYALAGGIDAALLVSLARRRGLHVVAYTLRPHLAADAVPSDPARYDEHEAAIAIATRLGIELHLVDADDADFREALPAALRAIETPLYNLHPVARMILARRAAADGHAILVTGDGADQRCARTSGADYLPLVDALTVAAGLRHTRPYLAAGLAALEGDLDKRALRELLARDLPEVAARPKRGRYAPTITLDGLTDEGGVRELAARLGPTRLPAGDGGRVGSVTCALVAQHLGLA